MFAIARDWINPGNIDNNAHLIQKMQKNSIIAEKCQKCRKIPLIQKNSINAEKFN
jgi:hypothetical protein